MLSDTTNFTVAGWFNSSVAQYRPLLEFAIGPGNYGPHIWLDTSNSQCTAGHDFYINVADTSSVDHTMCPTVDVNENTWNYIVLTYNGFFVRFYVNGVEVSTLAMTNTVNTDRDFYIGARNPTWQNVTFNGKIDEVSVWNRSLAAEEVTTLYNSRSGFSQTNFKIRDQNLIAYYKFNDSNSTGTLARDSIFGNNGSLSTTGIAFVTTGMWDTNDVNFSGTGQVVVPTSSRNDITSDFTFIAWVKRNTPISTSQFIVSKTTGATNGFGLWINGSNQLDGFIGNGSFKDTTTSTTFSDTTAWHHIAFTSQSGVVQRIYIDGVNQPVTQPQGGPYAAPASSAASSLGFGMDTTSSSNKFNGQLDDIKLYNRALTAAEIVADYNGFMAGKFVADTNSIIAGPNSRRWNNVILNSTTPYRFNKQLETRLAGDINLTPLASTDPLYDVNLKSLWHLDGNAIDSIGNNNGTVSSATVTTGLWDTNAYTFGGSAYITVANSASINITGSVTTAAWINYSSQKNPSGIICKGAASSSGPSYCMAIATNGGNKLLFQTGIPPGLTTSNAVWSNSVIPTNTWVHVVAVYDKAAGKNRVYVNGVLDGEGTGVDLGYNASEPNLYIGKWRTNYEFVGKIDEAALWDRALTSAEIAQLYTSQAGKFSDPNLVGLWHFNDRNAQGWALNSATGVRDANMQGNADTNVTGLWDTNAVVLNGTSSQVTVPSSSALTILGPVTVSGWLKLAAMPGAAHYPNLAGKNADNAGYMLFVHGDQSQMVFSINNVGPVANISADNLWHQWTGVYNGVTCSLYRDGILVGQQGCVTNPATNTNPFIIGRHYANSRGDWLNGRVDEVAVWNTALTPQQVKDWYIKGAARLDLNVYTCSDANCATRTSSQYVTDANNNSWMPLNLARTSQYLGYDVLPKAATGMNDFNATRYFTNAFFTDIQLDTNIGNATPVLTFNSLSGQALSATSPNFSVVQDGNLTIDFNVLDTDGDPLALSVWYDAGSAQDSGTLVYTDSNVGTLAACTSVNWASASARCTLPLALGSIPDGNYYLKIRLKDSSNASTSFVSTRRFVVDNNAPSLVAVNTNTSWLRTPATITLTCTDALVGCGSVLYRVDMGAWSTYTTPFTFSYDGNYRVDYNAVDSKGNATSIQTTYALVGFNGALRTYTDTNVPESYFAMNQHARLIFDANSSNTPLARITDANGVSYSFTMTNISGDATFGKRDLNTYLLDVDVNGALGWYTVTIQNQVFENAFYNANVWMSRFTNPFNQAYPFSFSLDVNEPNMITRWFAPVDTNVSFAPFKADRNSVRVLVDYNGGAYLEIPAQLYAPTYSGGLITSTHIVFLSTLAQQAHKQYFVSFSSAAYAQNTISDLAITSTNSSYDINSSMFTALIDLNKGGAIVRVRNKQGTNTDLNATSTQSIAPEALVQGSSYDISAVTAPQSTLTSGALKTTIFVSGVRTYSLFEIFDYNLLYTFYAKSRYYTVDTNYLVKTPSSNYTLYDVSEQLSTDKFDTVSYAGATRYTLSTAGSMTTITDANYLGAYKVTSLDGVGNVFLSSTSLLPLISTPEKTNLFGILALKRKLANASTFANGDFVSSKRASVVFNALTQDADLNAAFVELLYPLVVMQTSSPINNDSGSAPVLVDSNYTPLGTITDQNDVTCSSSWTDDTIVGSVFLNVHGPNIDVNVVSVINDQNGSVTYDINHTGLHGGSITCSFYAVDAANHTSSIAPVTFFVSDTRAPVLYAVANTPDTNAAIDPDTNVRVDANVTEYTGLSSVFLYTRYSAGDGNFSDWNASDMNRENVYSDVNFGYSTTFTATQGIWQYFVQARDVNGLDSNSSIHTFYAFTDYTWDTNVAPLSFGNKSGSLNSRITVGTFTITNTGDAALSFKIKSDWDVKYSSVGSFAITYNETDEENSGYLFSLARDENKTIVVQLQAKENQRQDQLTITTTALTPGVVPDTNVLTATIISFKNGPFLLLQWIDTNAAVTQGDAAVSYGVQITNLGNAPATDMNIDWNYPLDWVVASNQAHLSGLTLAVDEYLLNTITFDVNADAALGMRTITLQAGCCNDTNRTNVTSTTTLVSAKSVIIIPDPCANGACIPPTGTGGGGGGGGGGAASSSPFVNEEQRALFFQTKQYFELIRGKNDYFPITVTNPLDGNMVDVNLSVSGIMAKYLDLLDSHISRLDSNQSFETRIKILSPKYFNPGEYEIKFTIVGVVQRGTNVAQSFTESRTILLLIHDTDLNTASALGVQMQDFVTEFTAKGFKLGELDSWAMDANRLIAQKRYDEAAALFVKAKEYYDAGIKAEEGALALVGLIGVAEGNGIDIPSTRRIQKLARLSFARGEYALALERLKEAELTYSLETKGEFNWGLWAYKNWQLLLVLFILMVILIRVTVLLIKLSLLTRHLQYITRESDLILGLIKEAQQRCFVENKISIGSYYDALNQYEGRLAELSEDLIETQSKKSAVFNFRTAVSRLNVERKDLLALIKKTQGQYFEAGLIETRVYKTKMNSMTKRLGEVDEQIVLHEMQKITRLSHGVTRVLWRPYYAFMR